MKGLKNIIKEYNLEWLVLTLFAFFLCFIIFKFRNKAIEYFQKNGLKESINQFGVTLIEWFCFILFISLFVAWKYTWLILFAVGGELELEFEFWQVAGVLIWLVGNLLIINPIFTIIIDYWNRNKNYIERKLFKDSTCAIQTPAFMSNRKYFFHLFGSIKRGNHYRKINIAITHFLKSDLLNDRTISSFSRSTLNEISKTTNSPTETSQKKLVCLKYKNEQYEMVAGMNDSTTGVYIIFIDYGDIFTIIEYSYPLSSLYEIKPLIRKSLVSFHYIT